MFGLTSKIVFSFVFVSFGVLQPVAEAGITGRGLLPPLLPPPFLLLPLPSFLYFSLLLSSNFHGVHGGRGGLSPLAPTLDPPLRPTKGVGRALHCSPPRTAAAAAAEGADLVQEPVLADVRGRDLPERLALRSARDLPEQDLAAVAVEGWCRKSSSCNRQ